MAIGPTATKPSADLVLYKLISNYMHVNVDKTNGGIPM